MKNLIDAIAARLGYVSGGTFDDVTETYARRILALGDEIMALKRQVANLAGMLAAADGRREADVAALARHLAIQKALRAAVDDDRRKLHDAAIAFRAATEEFA